MSYIHGLIRDPQAAEDIYQEVWLRLANQLENGSIQHQERWCRQVARNLIIQLWRKQQTSKLVVDSTLLEFLEFVDQSYEETQSFDSQWAQRQRALNDCVASLPDKSKQLLFLKYDERQPIDSIATSLSQSASAVAKALVRLRQALMSCVEKKLKWRELES